MNILVTNFLLLDKIIRTTHTRVQKDLNRLVNIILAYPKKNASKKS